MNFNPAKPFRIHCNGTIKYINFKIVIINIAINTIINIDINIINNMNRINI